MLGLDASMNDYKPWQATVGQVREAVLQWHVTGHRFEDVDLLPEGRMFAPLQAEVEMASEMAHAAVTAGRMIDFGTLPNDVLKAGGMRGGALWNAAAFGMPFSEPWILYHTWEGGVGIYLVNPSSDEATFEVCELHAAKVENEPMLALADRGRFTRNPAEQGKRYFCEVLPAMLRFVADDAARAIINDGSTPENSAIGNIGDPVMTALLILNTRNVARETITVSAKLQKARQKRGKLPIPPFDRVNSAGYVTAIMARGQPREKGEDQGGHHASPVPHIRMGHPRTLSSGKSMFIRDPWSMCPRASEHCSRAHGHTTLRR